MPVDLVTVLQALIVLFIAAPALVRSIFRLRADRGGAGQVSRRGGTDERRRQRTRAGAASSSGDVVEPPVSRRAGVPSPASS